MPKELTHWIIAHRSLTALKPDSGLRQIIVEHRELYLAGAVLPDTLMHLFRGPHASLALELAHRFHNPSANSYHPILRAAARFPEGLPPDLLACLLGVISHMQADIALHPYVFAQTAHAGIGEHYRLETAIDVDLVRNGASPPVRLLKTLLDPARREVLITATTLLFDPEVALPRPALERALDLHALFQGMYDRPHWKLAAGLLGRLLGSPLREQRHLFYPLRKPGKGRDGGPDRALVERMAQQAVEETARLFACIEAGSLEAALSDPPGANLLTGRFGATL